DVIGTAHIGRHLIELAYGDIVVVIPAHAAIVAAIDAAIVADPDGAWILRIDPERVVIRVRTGERPPGLAAIERHLSGVAADKDLLIVDRVDSDLAKVHRPLVLVAHQLPRLAAVIGAVNAAGIRIGPAFRRAGAA